MAKRYDLAIIGGGSAGLTAARFANRLGKRVALIEENRLGGDCTWSGCVPSKALLHAAKLAHAIRNARRVGLSVPEPITEFPAVMSRIRAVIERIYSDESPQTLREEGIDVIEDRAEFLDNRKLVAGGTEISAKRFLICTGATPFIPPIPGLDRTPFLTYETFWQLQTLPSRLVIIGGGPIGSEVAQACQRLGSQVTLIEALDRILPGDDPEAAQLVAQSLAADGVDLRLSAPVDSVGAGCAADTVSVSAGGVAVAADALLVAVGRRPTVSGLGLEAAGIAHTERGICVNHHLRTRVKNIYAAGDCIGGHQFTHYAGFQGALAVRNALLPGNSRGIVNWIPWATFTDPEIAQTGYTETQARDHHGHRFRTSIIRMDQVDRAVIEDAVEGFIKVIHSNNGRVLGAIVVGPRASEVMQEWAIAIQHNMKLSDVLKTMHAYPSLTVGNQQLAWDVYMGALSGGITGKLLRWMSR